MIIEDDVIRQVNPQCSAISSNSSEAFRDDEYPLTKGWISEKSPFNSTLSPKTEATSVSTSIAGVFPDQVLFTAVFLHSVNFVEQ